MAPEGSLSKPAFLKKPPARPPPAKVSGLRAVEGKPVLPMSPAKTLGGSAASAKIEGGSAPVSVSFLKRAPVGPGAIPKRASADTSEAPMSSTPREEEETEAVDSSESPLHNEEDVAEEVEEATSDLHANFEEEGGTEAAREATLSRGASSNVDEEVENVPEEGELLTPHEAADASSPDDSPSRIQSGMDEQEEADSHEAQDAPSSLTNRDFERGSADRPALSPAEEETRAPPPPGHQETFDASTTYSADTLHSATVSKSAKVKLLDSIEPEGAGPPPGCRCCCCKQQRLQAEGVSYVPEGLPQPLPSSSCYPGKARTSVFAAPQMHAPGSFAWAPYAYPLPPVQPAHYAPAAHPVSSNSGLDVELQLNATWGPEATGDADDSSSESDLEDYDHRWGMTKDDPRWAKVNYEERLRPAPPLVSARHVNSGRHCSGIAGPAYRTVYTRPKNYKMGNTYCKHYQLPTVASLLRAGMPEFLRKRPIKIMTEGSGRNLQLDGAFEFEVELKTETDACNSCTHSPCSQGFHPQLQTCCSTEASGLVPTATTPVCSHGCPHSPMHAHTPAWPAAVEGAPDGSSNHMVRAPDGYGGSGGGGAPLFLCQGSPQPLQQMGPPSYGGGCWQVPLGRGEGEVHPGVCTAQVDATGSSLWPPPSSHARFSVDHSGRAEAEARDQWSRHHFNSCQLPRPSFSQAPPLLPASRAQDAPVRSAFLCSRGDPGFLSRGAIERDIHVIGAQGKITGNNNPGVQGTFKGGLRLAVSPPAKRLW
ncbi:hypothetical protein Emag_001881 [Eimeria magna]